MGFRLRCALLLILAGIALLVFATERIPSRIADDENSVTEFSEARARAIVNTLAHKPHAVGSQEHTTIRETIRHELKRLKLAVSEQQSDTAIRMAGSQQSGNVRNILGIVPGSDPNAKGVMLAAHYDSAPNSRGASDDGAGVATLLETARALTAGPRLRRSVYFLFTDAEELGLLGAQAFVQEHPLARRVGLVVNFEARGTSGPVLMYQTSPNNGQLIAAYGHAAPYPHSNSLINRLARILPNDADASIFARAGYPVLAFAFVEGFEHYHRFTDSPENLDPRSLSHCGATALALAKEFAQSANLPGNASDAVYFELFGRFLISYPTVLAKILGAILAFVWIVFLRRELAARRVTGSGIARGIKLQIASVGIALVVPVMLHLLRILMVDMAGLIKYAVLYGGADLFVVTALNLLFYGSAIRQVTLRDLVLGGLSLSALLSLVLGWMVPDASAPWQWITAISLIVWKLEPSILPQRTAVRVVWLHVPLFFAILLLGPSVLSAMAAAGPSLMPIPIVLLGTVTGLFLATLLLKEFRQVYLVSAFAAFVGFGSMFGITLYSNTSQAHHHENSLIYTYDVNSRQSRYASDGLTNDTWTSGLVPSAVAARPMPAFTLTTERWRQVNAPSYPLQLPEIDIRELPNSGSQRLVELQIKSIEHARCLRLWQTEGPTVKTYRVNNKPVEQFVRFSPEFDEMGMQLMSGLRTRAVWRLHHCGQSDAPLTLQLQLLVKTGVKLRLVEERESFPEPMLLQLTPRPPGIVPGPDSDETWVGRDIEL
jgi:hypothetical protein